MPGSRWTITPDPTASGGDAWAASVLCVGNGFIGVRGLCEEDDGALPAVFLNGVYERLPITYHEKAPGFAGASDTRLPVPSP
ncbi:MAG: hypothetical protein D6773_10510, partial [Alphaproteobacteria bacterium]